MHLVDHRGRVAERLGQPLGELETQIQPVGADVDQQVTWCAGGEVDRPAELRQAMEVGRARGAVEAVPSVGADPDYARQAGLGHAESDRAADPAGVGEHRRDRALATVGDGEHEEDRRYRTPPTLLHDLLADGHRRMMPHGVRHDEW
jgi:hypothetical protein